MSHLEFQPIGGYECEGDERRRYFQFLNWLGVELRYAKLYSDGGLHAKTIKAGLLPPTSIPGRESNADLDELGAIPTDRDLYGGLHIQNVDDAIAVMNRILAEREVRLGAEMFEHSIKES